MTRLVLAMALLGVVGCKAAGGVEREVVHVFAASSLTEAFTALERGYESTHPHVDVVMSFAGSQVLRMQLEGGARADVFASADRAHMDALVEAGLVERSEALAANGLAVIVPPDNPAAITALEDLPRARRVVVGAATVPVGRYTRALLERAGVDVNVVSEESNVRLVRAKVALGVADAAIVYRTDALSSPQVTMVPIPDEQNIRADYHIGAVRSSDAGARFMQFVASDEGRQILRQNGFSLP